MINKQILCVTDMHITPRASEEVRMEQDVLTKDILHYGPNNTKPVVIQTFVSEIDYTVSGITTDGKNFKITFRDPKELKITYKED